MWFESRCHGWCLQHSVVALLGFGRRDVADGLQGPAIVEPVDPFQSGELDGFEEIVVIRDRGGVEREAIAAT